MNVKSLILIVIAFLTVVFLIFNAAEVFQGLWDGLTIPFCLLFNIFGAEFTIYRPELSWVYKAACFMGLMIIAAVLFE
jgi:hypothetical protein